MDFDNETFELVDESARGEIRHNIIHIRDDETGEWNQSAILDRNSCKRRITVLTANELKYKIIIIIIILKDNGRNDHSPSNKASPVFQYFLCSHGSSYLRVFREDETYLEEEAKVCFQSKNL